MILHTDEDQLDTGEIELPDEDSEWDSALEFDGDSLEFDHEIFKTTRLTEVA